MPAQDQLRFRAAEPGDAAAIAALHAASWQRHYRGAFPTPSSTAKSPDSCLTRGPRAWPPPTRWPAPSSLSCRGATVVTVTAPERSSGWRIPSLTTTRPGGPCSTTCTSRTGSSATASARG